MRDIVWGCVTTIFICTWVSYHPDVPDIRYSERRIFAIRILSVLSSVIAPEMLLVKAFKDWFIVRNYQPSFHGTLDLNRQGLTLVLYAERSIRLDSNALILYTNGGI